jgi:hypothetical protein
MDNPADIVVSLEDSKRMIDLGWPKTKAVGFHWVLWKGDSGWTLEPFDTAEKVVIPHNANGIYPALTAEEVLAELPMKLDDKYILSIKKLGNGWLMFYWDDEANEGYMCSPDAVQMDEKSLVNAAAKMWMYLKSNNLLPDE